MRFVMRFLKLLSKIRRMKNSASLMIVRRGTGETPIFYSLTHSDSRFVVHYLKILSNIRRMKNLNSSTIGEKQ